MSTSYRRVIRALRMRAEMDKSQLIKDLESCVQTAKLAGPPWGMYTRMEITAEHAKKILAVVKAGDRLRDVFRLLPKNIYNDATLRQADEAKDAWDQAKAELEGE